MSRHSLSPDRLAIDAEGKRDFALTSEWQDDRPETLNNVSLFRRTDTDLYHYTDIKTLYLILEKEVFWARHVRFSSDSRELTVGFDFLAKHESGDVNGQRQLSMDRLDGYMICLCASDNLLSMWRGYAHKQGVAIGLDLAGPASFVLKHNERFPMKSKCEKGLSFAPLCENHQKRDGVEPIQVVYVDDDCVPECSQCGKEHLHCGEQCSACGKKARKCMAKVRRPEDRRVFSTNAKDFVGGFGQDHPASLNPGGPRMRKKLFAPYVKTEAFLEEREFRLLFDYETFDLTQRDVVFYDETRGDGVERPHVEVMCAARIANPRQSYVLVDKRLVEKLPDFTQLVNRLDQNCAVVTFEIPVKNSEKTPCNVYCYEKPSDPPRDDGSEMPQDAASPAATAVMREDALGQPLSRRMVDAVREWALVAQDLEVKVWSENCWPIRSITVGPQENQDQVVEALRHFCRNTWYLRDVDVRPSVIPYRPPVR